MFAHIYFSTAHVAPLDFGPLTRRTVSSAPLCRGEAETCIASAAQSVSTLPVVTGSNINWPETEVRRSYAAFTLCARVQRTLSVVCLFVCVCVCVCFPPLSV